jgi:hypothetical protein
MMLQHEAGEPQRTKDRQQFALFFGQHELPVSSSRIDLCFVPQVPPHAGGDADLDPA